MLHFLSETLPFVIFGAIGIAVLAEPDSRRLANAAENGPRPRRFCGYLDGGTLVLADPDGKLVPRGGNNR